MCSPFARHATRRACSVNSLEASNVGSVSSDGQLFLIGRDTSDVGRFQRGYRTGS